MPIQLKQNGEHFASHLKECFVAIVNVETNFFGQDSSASMKSQTFSVVSRGKSRKKPTTPCDRDGMKNGK